MNLGQVFGEMQLRITELEEQLAKQAGTDHGTRHNLMPRVRALLREHGLLSIDEMAELIPDVPRALIAKNVQVTAAQGKLQRSVADGGLKMYSLPEGVER